MEPRNLAGQSQLHRAGSGGKHGAEDTSWGPAEVLQASSGGSQWGKVPEDQEHWGEPCTDAQVAPQEPGRLCWSSKELSLINLTKADIDVPITVSQSLGTQQYL